MASEPIPPPVGVWRIRAEQRCAGRREALQMHLVTNAVPGPREVDPVLRGDGLQEAMIVGVLEARLQHVVVHIADRQLGLHPRHSHRLKLQIRHRARGVLSQRLVDPDADLFAGHELPLDQMPVEDFLDKILSHHPPSKKAGISPGLPYFTNP